MLSLSLQLERLYRISHEHRDGERPDAARDRRDKGGPLARLLKLDIAYDLVAYPVYPDVHHDGALFHPFTLYYACPADRHDEHFSPLHMSRQISPLAGCDVTDRGSGKFIQEQEADRFADYLAMADYHRLFSVQIDPCGFYQFHDGERCARSYPHLAEYHLPHVLRMHPLHIFQRVYVYVYLFGIYMAWERQLQQYAGDRDILV